MAFADVLVIPLAKQAWIVAVEIQVTEVLHLVSRRVVAHDDIVNVTAYLGAGLAVSSHLAEFLGELFGRYTEGTDQTYDAIGKWRLNV